MNVKEAYASWKSYLTGGKAGKSRPEPDSDAIAVGDLRNWNLALTAEVSDLKKALEAAKAPVDVAELKKTVSNLEKRVSDLIGERDSARESLGRLERSKGLSAANVIVSVPASADSADGVLETFNQLKGTEATQFYNRNREQLLRSLPSAPSP